MVQAKKLYWNADGTTNLPELKADVIQASSKGANGIYSVCLVTSKIPKEWIDEFPMITEREWVLMIDPEEKKLYDIMLAQYEGVVRQGWEHSRPSMCHSYFSTSRNLLRSVYWTLGIKPATRGTFLCPRGHLFMPRGHCLATKGHLFVPWGQLFVLTLKLNLHLILTFFFYKMLKDYEFDESGIVFLLGT